MGRLLTCTFTFFVAKRLSSPYINRFIQPDSIIPDQSNPQSWNRFSYVHNSPIIFSDPSGHDEYSTCGGNSSCMKYVKQNPELVDTTAWVINKLKKNNKPPIEDSEWNKKKPEERAPLVWDAICQSGGWWGSGCPNEQQLATWLLYEEGSTLSPFDQANMVRGIRYRFAIYGNTPESFIFQLSGFTAFYNPDGDSDFDQVDWNELTNPQVDLTNYSLIVEAVYSTELRGTDGNYMYWWDEGEVKTPRNQWPGESGVDYFPTREVTGQPFYFTGIPNIQNCAMRGVNCK